jgi:hypothetical protein
MKRDPLAPAPILSRGRRNRDIAERGKLAHNSRPRVVATVGYSYVKNRSLPLPVLNISSRRCAPDVFYVMGCC